jgi:hypothetical protein
MRTFTQANIVGFNVNRAGRMTVDARSPPIHPS